MLREIKKTVTNNHAKTMQEVNNFYDLVNTVSTIYADMHDVMPYIYELEYGSDNAYGKLMAFINDLLLYLQGKYDDEVAFATIYKSVLTECKEDLAYYISKEEM